MSGPAGIVRGMAANITIMCPTCEQDFGLRFDPGSEDSAPLLARLELTRECPNHQDKESWAFQADLAAGAGAVLMSLTEYNALIAGDQRH
jgi:hypothetical protein